MWPGNLIMIQKKIALVSGIVTLLVTLFLSTACAPVVRVEASDKPITINLNVKIEHEIRVKVEKEVDQMLSEDSGLF